MLDAESNRVDRKPHKIGLKRVEATKQGCDYFMVSEILEQPKVPKDTLNNTAITEAARDTVRAEGMMLTALYTEELPWKI